MNCSVTGCKKNASTNCYIKFAKKSYYYCKECFPRVKLIIIGNGDCFRDDDLDG